METNYRRVLEDQKQNMPDVKFFRSNEFVFHNIQ